MNMSKLHDVNEELKNYTAIRAQARKAVESQAESLRSDAEMITNQATALLRKFDNDWRDRKEQLKAERDALVKIELAKGIKAQPLLKELGSNNRQWMYELLAEVKAGNYDQPKGEAPAPTVPDGTVWLYHDHSGVHRYLLSADHTLVKVWGAPDTDRQDDFFVADREGTFVGGSAALYSATPKALIKKKAAELDALLTGTYTKQIRDTEPNRWVH